MTFSTYEARRAARSARLRRAREAKEAAAAKRRANQRYRIPCMRCGEPRRPAVTFGNRHRRLRVCTTCWPALSRAQKEELRDAAAKL